MAQYLVKAKPKLVRLKNLRERLDAGEITIMRPFGRALDFSLKKGKIQEDGYALWEEEDYCDPPLAQERLAVLDYYFDDISVEKVEPDRGWKRIASLSSLWSKP
ncbi:MAG: hypothetical protein OK422_06395 [Thaumarchaeota archaeon]|nr:hypothetical protein [Nitrososphaerota archaeon]